MLLIYFVYCTYVDSFCIIHLLTFINTISYIQTSFQVCAIARMFREKESLSYTELLKSKRNKSIRR